MTRTDSPWHRLRRSFAVSSGIVALSGLLTACGSTLTAEDVSTDPPAQAAQGIVLSTELSPDARTRYERALAELGVPAAVASSVAPGNGAVALGLAIPGADAVVMMDVDAAGRMLARELATCLTRAGVIAGPIVIDGALSSAQMIVEEKGFTPVVGDDAFDTVYRSREGDVVGVVAASADRAAAAIEVLDANAQAIKIPVVASGVDDRTVQQLDEATLCAAVRPAYRAETRAAVELSNALADGADPDAVADERIDVGGRPVAAVFVKPSAQASGEGE